MSEFAQWKHHPTQDPKLFTSQEAYDAAGPEWRDSPAWFTGEPMAAAEPIAEPSVAFELSKVALPDPMTFVVPTPIDFEVVSEPVTEPIVAVEAPIVVDEDDDAPVKRSPGRPRKQKE